MTRLFVLTAAASVTAVAAFAATEAILTPEPEVIEIRVPAEKLAECRQTLRDVAQMPAVTDDGSPIWFDNTDSLPQVACVLEI